MTYHEEKRQKMIEACKRLNDAGHNEDQIYDWVQDKKFDEFATIKDRYEEDLEYYVEENFVELVNEYLKQLT